MSLAAVAWLASMDIVAALAVHPAPEALARASAPPSTRWRCEVAYLPARSTWARHVEIETDGQRVTALRIDGLAPHAFTLVDTALVTSLDNERIVIDLDSREWQSDFRGLAQGRGRCEEAEAVGHGRQPPALGAVLRLPALPAPPPGPG